MKAPFRVLYSNDCGCASHESPYHRPGEPFTPDKLRASIEEAAGADVHLLQPGSCEVAHWRSREEPIREHYRWFEERYGVCVAGHAAYVVAGGDVFDVLIDHCRRVGQAPFASLRLNDAHGKEYVNCRKGEVPAPVIAQNISRFYVEHPEYRLGPDVRKWYDHVYNWAEPEVRRRKLAFVAELCAYDVDGLELDFMRHLPYFRVRETTSAERAAIMTEFVRAAREALDASARAGRRRWLCVRVPCFTSLLDPNGLALRAFAAAGVDMFNVSTTYYTEQDTDLAAIRAMLPEASVYGEMCHSSHKHKLCLPDVDGPTLNRLVTAEQYCTTAHLAYRRAGVDGVSFYNFQYYRDRQRAPSGEMVRYEPPFEVLQHIGDAAWVARQPQHWFLAPGSWTNGYGEHQVPRRLAAGETVAFRLDMAPPEGGWTGPARLRVQTRAPLGSGLLRARLGGVELPGVDDVLEPYGSPYHVLVGDGETLRAWAVPLGLLKDGTNDFAIGLTGGEAAEVVFVDVAAR